MGKEKTNLYEPSYQNRFEISSDVFSQARYRALIQGYNQLKSTYEYFVGLGLFGSLSKGKILTPESAPDTDVDVNLFVDTDRLGFADAKNDHVLKPIQELLEPSLEEILRSSSQSGIKTVDFYTRGISAIPHHYGSLQFLFWQLGEANSVFDEFYIPAAMVVATPFSMDIEGGLRPYIHAFLQDMVARGSERDWQLVDRCVRIAERDEKIPPSLEPFYPRTLSQACEYYALWQ